MTPFSISEAALRLFRSADIDPARINDVMDRRAAARTATILGPGDRHPVLVRQRTGVPLMMIRRSRRHLYVTVEWRMPLVRYVEYGREDCRLLILQAIAESVQVAATGRSVDRLVAGVPFLEGQICEEVRSCEPFTEAKIKVAWLRWTGCDAEAKQRRAWHAVRPRCAEHHPVKHLESRETR
ncbi:hypothetical protein [Sphingomonas corticis]|uniref:Uncharacterized protein n=1 Tax=Sphingomonas corticis TaxID=2722791 RepID=A0ABX1CW34_9SPHN|nr:hypothetical protein [Sphingomonas corticis]NJR80500.1 hypothetical protein [Sphingomonas corticis]